MAKRIKGKSRKVNTVANMERRLAEAEKQIAALALTDRLSQLAARVAQLEAEREVRS